MEKNSKTAAADKPKQARRSRKTEQPDNPFVVDGEWDKPKVMEYVCGVVATKVVSIASVLDGGANGYKLPTYLEFTSWLAADPELERAYARAKQSQADVMAEELIEIADDGRNDYMEKLDRDGSSIGYFINGETTRRSQLRLDTRKWLMAKLRPQRYGDAMKLVGDPAQPLSHVVLDPVKLASLSDAELQAAISLAKKLQGGSDEESKD